MPAGVASRSTRRRSRSTPAARRWWEARGRRSGGSRRSRAATTTSCCSPCRRAWRGRLGTCRTRVAEPPLTRIGVLTRRPGRTRAAAERHDASNCPEGSSTCVNATRPCSLHNRSCGKSSRRSEPPWGSCSSTKTTIRDSRYAARQALRGRSRRQPPSARRSRSRPRPTARAKRRRLASASAPASPPPTRRCCPVGTVVRLDTPDSRYDGIWTIMDTGPAVQGRHRRSVSVELPRRAAVRPPADRAQRAAARAGIRRTASPAASTRSIVQREERDARRLPDSRRSRSDPRPPASLTPPVVPAVAQSAGQFVRSARTAARTAGDRCPAAPAAPDASPTRAARPCGTPGCDPCPGSSTADARSRSSSGPRISTRSASRISSSVSVSMLDVASSSISTGGSNASARANDSSCFCPTDSVAPRSTTVASRPPSASTNRSACTAVSARRTSASLMRGVAQPHVAGNRAGEQMHVLQHEPEDARAARSSGSSRMSTPSTRDAPAGDVVEPQQQVDDRRLAGAGGADDADALARFDRERRRRGAPSRRRCRQTRRARTRCAAAGPARAEAASYVPERSCLTTVVPGLQPRLRSPPGCRAARKSARTRPSPPCRTLNFSDRS